MSEFTPYSHWQLNLSQYEDQISQYREIQTRVLRSRHRDCKGRVIPSPAAREVSSHWPTADAHKEENVQRIKF